MKDPIERQDAIDALADYIHNVDKVIGTGHLSADDCKDAATSVLEDIPSAQYADCLKCIFRGSPGFKQFQPKTEERTAESVQNVSDSDLISRKAAIDAMGKAVWAKERLRELPSAQPERQKGEWIEISSISHTYKCSECGRLLVNITDGKNNVAKNYPYCHCGADMRGKQDG